MARDQASPSPPGFQAVSTAHASPIDRFEVWRETFQDIELTVASRKQARDFDADCIACVGQDGVGFVSVRSPAVIAQFRPDAGDYVTLGGLESGQGVESSARHQTALKSDGRMFLVDAGRAPRVESFGHHKLYLLLPRALAMETMGGDAVMRRQPVLHMPDTGTTRILWAHMRAIAANASGLDAHDAATAMQAASLLALATLRQTRPAARSDTGLDDSELVAAAKQIIMQKNGRANLKAEALAAALGCSRNRLFAAFQSCETSLSDLLLEVRMGHARTLLTHPGLGVETIAGAVGYADASSFGKAFRRRHGVSPGEWRAAASLPPPSRDIIAQDGTLPPICG